MQNVVISFSSSDSVNAVARASLSASMPSKNHGPFRYVSGPVAGIASFVIGYLLIYLWRARDIEQAIEPMETVLAIFQAEPIGSWRVVGWLFYSGHFIDIRISARMGPVETTVYIDLISEGSGNLELLYLFPPILLLVSGFLIVSYLDIDRVVDGATLGASITVGYLIAIALGLLLFAYGDTRPDPVPALIIAGIIYPAVFGGLGGVVAAVVNDRR